MRYPRLILAGTHSSVGKTTLALGIILALRKRGFSVAPFKVGPDYIDPGYHTEIAGKKSRNLDSWMFSGNAVLELFSRQAQDADISIIEGVMGLYDGLQDTQEGSTAQIAKILASPVILIVNAKSLSRSAGALVLGYKKFDKNVHIAGVILNNIASPLHLRFVKNSIERNTDIPVLGHLPKDSGILLTERHLGLVPAVEKRLSSHFYRKMLYLVEKNIRIHKIIRIAKASKALPLFKKSVFINRQNPACCINMAVAFDEAFNFYYHDNLDILKFLGARLVFFSPLWDKTLPKNIHGLYIGGGYPELFARQLSRNTRLKQDIYSQARDGLPIYAECGGLMYLMDAIVDFSAAGGSACGGKKKKFPMVGIFKGETAMSDRPAGLGYVTMQTMRNNILSRQGDLIRGHIFHWSYLKKISGNSPFAYRIEKNGKVFYDGLVNQNVLASYAHLHFAANPNFPKSFIQHCQEYKNENN